MLKKGAAQVVYAAVAQAPSEKAKLHIGPFNALILHHYIAGNPATGGYVSLSMSDSPDGNFIAHHDVGDNLPAGNVTASYTALFRGLMDYVEIELHITDGEHTVTIQPLMLA